MLLLLNTLWFIRTAKYILFWLYLWQLKEYHIGRFFDHFRTHKGKKLIFNNLLLLKIVLFCSFVLTDRFLDFGIFILTLLYLVEAVLFIYAVIKGRFKKPVLTSKSLFLIFVVFAITIYFTYFISLKATDYNSFVYILGFDIFTPVVVSVIVLLFQPIAVFMRNIILQKAGTKMAGFKNLTVIAITGSYGKTTTKEFLLTILAKKFKVLATNAHQNSEIGIANCIINDLKPEHQVFVAEVGAYNKGKVKEVCSILRPKIGILTGVNEQHLALFGSLDNLLSAEGGRELVEALPENGIMIVNGDNKYCLDLYKQIHKTKKLYSLSNKSVNADVWADQISVYKDYITFLAMNKAGEVALFNVKVLGKQNVQNLLGAILIAKQLGMSFGEIAEACKNIKQEQAGMVLKQGKHGVTVVDSSYSSNPDGVFADLDYFSVLSGKKVIVMPCLIELGEKSVEIHDKIGKKIGEVCDYAIITTKDKFRELKRGAIQAGMPEKNILLCLPDGGQATSEEIYSAVTLFCKEGDAVLLEGRVPPGLLNKLLN